MEKQVDLVAVVQVKMDLQLEPVAQQQVGKVLQEAMVYLVEHIVVVAVVVLVKLEIQMETLQVAMD
jgi:hypothetical protein